MHEKKFNSFNPASSGMKNNQNQKSREHKNLIHVAFELYGASSLPSVIFLYFARFKNDKQFIWFVVMFSFLLISTKFQIIIEHISKIVDLIFYVHTRFQGGENNYPVP